jgi:hypothetical protein
MSNVCVANITELWISTLLGSDSFHNPSALVIGLRCEMGKSELLGEIVDSLPFAILVVTSIGSVAWWNKAAEQL